MERRKDMKRPSQLFGSTLAVWSGHPTEVSELATSTSDVKNSLDLSSDVLSSKTVTEGSCFLGRDPLTELRGSKHPRCLLKISLAALMIISRRWPAGLDGPQEKFSYLVYCGAVWWSAALPWPVLDIKCSFSRKPNTINILKDWQSCIRCTDSTWSGLTTNWICLDPIASRTLWNLTYLQKLTRGHQQVKIRAHNLRCCRSRHTHFPKLLSGLCKLNTVEIGAQ